MESTICNFFNPLLNYSTNDYGPNQSNLADQFNYQLNTSINSSSFVYNQSSSSMKMSSQRTYTNLPTRSQLKQPTSVINHPNGQLINGHLNQSNSHSIKQMFK